MARQVLVFDVDGVLVDVSESYRETIRRTVFDFTGRQVSRETIQDFKNRGGWNDDWILSHRLISDFGVEVPYERVVEHFNDLFLGRGPEGPMIERERWVAAPGLFERLQARFRLAIFTGRRRYELAPTLQRFCPRLCFDPVVTAESVDNLKPAPDGLLHIRACCPGEQLWYAGDTVDDARSARAAGVPFIGIASPWSPRHTELCEALRREGAIAVLDDINQLESALPA